MFFKETLNGTASWGNIFTSIEAFAPLAKAIFQKEGLTVKEEIQNLTPGTNAVFKADRLVIKIYAPRESGFHTEQDYYTELSVMKFAMEQGISVPRIIAYGELEDKYLFRYIVMDYVVANVPLETVLSFPEADKKQFVMRLSEITSRLNQPFDHLPPQPDLRNHPYRTERMNGLHPSLIQELEIRASERNYSGKVLVHGDITRDNVLLDSQGTLTLIDFADCMIAPEDYELPAIIFELFLGDAELVSAFLEIKGADKEEFLEELINGLSIHLFCGNILKDNLNRLGIPFTSVKNMDELKQLLRMQLFNSK